MSYITYCYNDNQRLKMSKHVALLNTQTFPTSKLLYVFLFCLILHNIILMMND